MTLTLGEALRLECPKGSRVIAGQAGLDRPIRFVNVMEVGLILQTGYLLMNYC